MEEKGIEDNINEKIDKKTGKKELEYVLSISGSKWQIIKTNFIAGIFRGAGFRNRTNYSISYYSNNSKRNSSIKYPGYWRIYN